MMAELSAFFHHALPSRPNAVEQQAVVPDPGISPAPEQIPSG
jgi:hypothetical protein